MSFAILGLGTAVPATVYDQDEGLRIAKSLCCRTVEQATWLPVMYEGTHIRKRHMVLPRQLVDDVLQGTRNSNSIFLPSGAPDDRGPTTMQRMKTYAAEAGPLALKAARQALAQSELHADVFTHLITVSCTGFHAPGVDTEIIEGLRLSPTIARTHIGFMGCHGALNGVSVGRTFTTADPEASVLLCAVELCSVHYFYGWDPGKVIANAIFADGAAAMVGVSGSAAPADAWRATACGANLFPGTRDAMTWLIGDHGYVMHLSKHIPGLIAAHLRPWIEQWLDQHRLALEDVETWAVHPGGPRIVAAVEEALALPPDKTRTSHDIFADFGNMSSPTILFIIDALRKRNAPRPCVALGFGPGLAVETTLFL
ncbi:MAG TPA: type III polyketide synthase [Gemmataceae bacterium]|nr:type III polyketide synthase [Gemmataceae bacterium]